MKTFKFNYIVSSERVAYIYADSKESAEEKLENIMGSQSEEKAIEEIEEKYVETIREAHMGIDFNSIKEVKDID